MEKVAEDEVTSINHPWITRIEVRVPWMTEEDNSRVNRCRSLRGLGVEPDDSWVGYAVKVAEAEIVG